MCGRVRDGGGEIDEKEKGIEAPTLSVAFFL